MPVVSAPVHGMFPQMQRSTLLGADPSEILQAGAVSVHMHTLPKVAQDVVEEVSVLKFQEELL